MGTTQENQKVGGPSSMQAPGRPGNGRRVLIGVPIFWNVDPLFFQSCMKAQMAVKTPCEFLPLIGDSAVQRARNRITRHFLEGNFTDLLFIDSDLVFSAEQIERIVAHEEPIVGGCYCKKGEGDPQLVMNRHNDERAIRPDHLLEVNYIGTGFLRIQRQVFERMMNCFGDETWYHNDSDKQLEHDFWHMGIYKYPDGTRRWLSEDWWFCQRAKDLGYKVWADMSIILKHIGHAAFPLQTQQAKLFGTTDSSVADAGASGVVPTSAAPSI